MDETVTSKDELRKALDRLGVIFAAEDNTPEAAERDVLANAIEAYERIRFLSD